MPDRGNIKVKVTIEGEYKAAVNEVIEMISCIDFGKAIKDGMTHIDVDIDVVDPE